jgi:hypothetical protein
MYEDMSRYVEVIISPVNVYSYVDKHRVTIDKVWLDWIKGSTN